MRAGYLSGHTYPVITISSRLVGGASPPVHIVVRVQGKYKFIQRNSRLVGDIPWEVKNGFDFSRGSIPYFGISILYIGSKRDCRVLYDNSKVAGDNLRYYCDHHLPVWPILNHFYGI
jgi:hypothetical protein